MSMKCKIPWTDSTGIEHDLSTADVLSIGEAASRLGIHKNTMQLIIGRGELRPLRRLSKRRVDVFVCVLTDYMRKIIK
jgi:hypothetical protein